MPKFVLNPFTGEFDAVRRPSEGWKFSVDLAGLKNGANTTYTAPDDFVATSFLLMVNGVRKRPGAGNDYTVTGTNTIQLAFPLISVDQITADYEVD